MFERAILPPKEYELKFIPFDQRSAPEFDPLSEPRVSLRTVGRFCQAVEYSDQENVPKTVPARKLSDSTLRRSVWQNRECWVPKPGVEDEFIHNMKKKYSTPAPDYNPNCQHRRKLFYRSFKFEIDCTEAKRQQKLFKKTERELEDYTQYYDDLVAQQKAREKPAIQIKSCLEDPPYWWKIEKKDEGLRPPPKSILKEQEREEGLRWTEKPSLKISYRDECDLKKKLLKVGVPYKNEACNWYYINYPPPNIKFRPEKFVYI